MEQKNNINWKQKFTSRKLWFAIAGVVIGLAMAFGVDGNDLEEVIGLITGAFTALGSIASYITGEAAVDAAAVKSADLAALFGADAKEEKKQPPAEPAEADEQ